MVELPTKTIRAVVEERLAKRASRLAISASHFSGDVLVSGGCWRGFARLRLASRVKERISSSWWEGFMDWEGLLVSGGR